MSVYELRGEGIRRFLVAPFTGMLAVVTILLLVLMPVGGWFFLPAPSWLAWIAWRTSRLRLRADAFGIRMVNLVRSYQISWADVDGVWAEEGHAHHPATLVVGRTKGRLWSVPVDATLGLGVGRQRELALDVAEIARGYGYGFPAGDGHDLKGLHDAGLFENRDPASHQAWWDSREPRRLRVR